MSREINYRERVQENILQEYGDFISKYRNEKNFQKIIDNAFMISFYLNVYEYLNNEGYNNLTDEEYKILDSVGKYPLFYMFQDFRGRDFDAVHTNEGAEAFTKSFIEEWENTIKLVGGNKGKDIVPLVKRHVDNEYQIFRMKEEGKPSKIVFDDCYEIGFYTQVRDYLCECEEDTECLEDKHYRVLYEHRGHILADMYDYYIKNEYAKVDSWAEIHDMICSYNEKHFQEILDKEEEIQSE